jgi:hypothetical protein
MQHDVVRCSLAVLGTLALFGCSSQHSQPDKVSGLQGWLGPQFFGAGTSGAGQSIAAGLDTVTCGDHPAPAGSTGPAPGAKSHLRCFFAKASQPAATVEWIVESAQDTQLVHVRLTMNPDFVDNTYGANSIGWPSKKGPGGKAMGPAGMAPPPAAPAMGPAGMNSMASDTGAHSFRDLVGSDHAEFKLSDAAGALKLHFKADYITADSAAASGYASLGVSGGDGKMISGSSDDIVAVSTSLARNLNQCGLSSYTVDSPATDASYTPNPAAPDWDYRVVYDVWVKASAFGSAGFGDALVDFVHASPSKAGSATVDVTPKTCPPGWHYCEDPMGCNDVCVNQPDRPCATVPPPTGNAGSGEDNGSPE